ncbi:MAG: NUDIX hydrolase [Patescibacteria group bacterium]
MKWETLNSKIVYKNPWIRVREDKIINPSGQKGIYGVVEIPDGVFVIALNKKDEILLVKQLRYCTGINSWEIPGGGLKPGKTIATQAKEELQEEANATFQSLEVLGKTQTQPGVTTQIDHFLLAYGTKYIDSQQKLSQKEEGINRSKFFPLKKIKLMIKKGEINHGQTITALMLYFLKKTSPKHHHFYK